MASRQSVFGPGRALTLKRMLLALFLTTLATVGEAAPQGFYSPYQSSYQPGASLHTPCSHGLSKRADGRCVQPRVSKDVFLFNAPKFTPKHGPPPHIPDPKIHYNFVFVRTPDGQHGPKPLVVPPPKQKTIVYLLSKKPGTLGQQVIEVPGNPSKPEVYYVSYDDGDNPTLPGGIDLRTALSHSAAAGGHEVGGGGFGGGFSGGNVFGSGNSLDHGLGAHGLGGHGLGSHGLGSHGHGSQGLGGHGVGVHGLGGLGLGSHGLGGLGLVGHGLGDFSGGAGFEHKSLLGGGFDGSGLRGGGLLDDFDYGSSGLDLASGLGGRYTGALASALDY